MAKDSTINFSGVFPPAMPEANADVCSAKPLIGNLVFTRTDNTAMGNMGKCKMKRNFKN